MIALTVDSETVERGMGMFKCTLELHHDVNYQNTINLHFGRQDLYFFNLKSLTKKNRRFFCFKDDVSIHKDDLNSGSLALNCKFVQLYLVSFPEMQHFRSK